MVKQLFLFLVIAGSAHAQSVVKSVSGILDTVHPDSIKKHIEFLADDRLKGRPPGTPEYKLAMDYVIARFSEMGIEPAGDHNTYLQTVTIRNAKVDQRQVKLSFGNVVDGLAFGSDYVVFPHFEDTQVELRAPLVFAGFGISAPEFGYDDYKGLDVKGKVVVIVAGAPDHFSHTVRSHMIHRRTLIHTALEKGAVGIIVRAASTTALKSSAQSAASTGVNTLLNKEQKMFYPSSKGGGLGLHVYMEVSEARFSALLNKSEAEITKTVTALRNGVPGSFALNETITLQYQSKYGQLVTYNLVGRITGSDPVLKKQHVVHSAHLDHVGITKPVKGDSINNGAHDNASGVSCTLEVARLYSRLNEKPKRSMLFVMVTAEEMGLLGSTYFGEYPTVEKQSIVANVNMDMPTIIAPLLSIVPLGAVHSSLMTQVKSAASYLKLDVEVDPEPAENRFTRSDQYSFVRQGIPALHIKYGDKTNTPGEKLTEKVKAWRSEFYHKPQDQLDGGIFDFEAGKKYVQLNFLISYLVAQDKKKPSWNKGDFFGNQYGKK